MSFGESQRGIVFNPWLCGLPGMPPLLLLPLQRQGIKETLHLFDPRLFADIFVFLAFWKKRRCDFLVFRDEIF